MSWAEKYRPRRVEDLVGHDAVKRALLGAIRKGGPLPHLLFAGPAGTGKTSAAHCLAAAVHGADKAAMFREVNASDARGIEEVRARLLPYMRTKGLTGVGQKVLFLDEGDALTADAQDALKRPMEVYAANCCVIIACNDPSRLSKPILSRLTVPGAAPGDVVNFLPLPPGAVADALVRVMRSEALTIPEALIPLVAGDIAIKAGGDVRAALGILEAAAMDGALAALAKKYDL